MRAPIHVSSRQGNVAVVRSEGGRIFCDFSEGIEMRDGSKDKVHFEPKGTFEE
jgi:hypothetical protein